MASHIKSSAPEKPRALVVQDPFHDEQRTARSVLQDLGYCVREAGRGVEAVSLARSWHPQIILLDTQLRDASGLEVESWIRSQPALREVPIVMMGRHSPAAQALCGHSYTVPAGHPMSSAGLRQSISSALSLRRNPGDKP